MTEDAERMSERGEPVASEPKFTQGPWGVAEEHHRLRVAPIIRFGTNAPPCVGSAPVADWRQPTSGARRGEHPRWYDFSQETRANAHLIAAAPELYEALKAWVEFFLFDRDDNSGLLMDMAQSALAKAEGRALSRPANRQPDAGVE